MSFLEQSTFPKVFSVQEINQKATKVASLVKNGGTATIYMYINKTSNS